MEQRVVRILLLLFAFSATALAARYCHTSQCTADRRQAWLLKSYQYKAEKFQKILQDVTCNPCLLNGFTPCYNNGTCRVTTPQKFDCDCPDNTSGKFCENILTCENENLCGINAECVIHKHNKTCQCPPGYTGDPNTECTLQTRQATVISDPHFTTFDGTYFNYMGTCPYYLMKACNSSIDFSVKLTSTMLPEWHYATWTKNLVLSTQGHEFRIDENMLVWIDGEQYEPPLFWPLDGPASDATIVITRPTDTVIIDDKVTGANIQFSVSFSYTNASAERSNTIITVPLTPFFFGTNTMCGLFGNIDGNCHNDIRARDGTILTVSNCSIGSNETVTQYVDTWVFNNTVDNCIAGDVFVNMSACDIPTSQQKCDLIRQAMDGSGAFGACQNMPHINQYYHDCTYDMCNNGSICDSLDIFAKHCLVYDSFANIDNWRTPSFCPYVCPPDSHYSMKTPSCQNTCQMPQYSNSSLCQNEAYNEGCICDPGYYKDSSQHAFLRDGYDYVCRPLDQCDCVDGNQIYSPNDHWLDDDCSISYLCYNGQLTSQAVSCSVNGQCFNETCECLPGYNGDGFNCTDINECVNPSVCRANVNQGICNNLPGTYNCTCLAPFGGSQCTEYAPSRHCADLQLFHGIEESGVYSVSIGADFSSGLTNDQLNWTEVYCDMENAGGGWTLMAHGNNTGGKKFVEYAAGFGDPSDKKVWLGLENIHAMTQSMATSLRLVLVSCHNDSFTQFSNIDCAYESFRITDASSQYAISLNSTCQNTNPNDTTPILEGWNSWKTNIGPKFSTFDVDDANTCSATFHQTGWWFDNNAGPCGMANLNGMHFGCGDNNFAYMNQYLTWHMLPIKDAHMFLRPQNYPNYDPRYNQ